MVWTLAPQAPTMPRPPCECGLRTPRSTQALALSAQVSSGYYGCQFYGFQDTVLANKGQQMYSGCLITGATDFIFGQQAQAWFEGCDIAVRNGGYYITANGRDSDSNPSYYLFNNCNVAAGSGESVSSGAFYLGRPWRTYARVVFQNSELSSVINSAGWSEWNGDDDVDNIFYAEYGNSGSGADGDRVDWATTLNSAVDMSTVLGDTSGAWYDSSYPS
ncbi:hypothetical protein NPX13_g8417 [Xylaria arbuscula]|uniref:Pectinesterase n=1 Tax=Xylaria arbuscula TaxID=114810 RepID=A0A9W8N8S6_9PEZI|nr:hypothetical protein NPX13_g8417 [Xylaria arbuscula]